MLENQTSSSDISQLARVIVRDILDDMLDRNGLQNALEEIDDETRDEMIATWECFVRGRLAQGKTESQ